MSEKIEQLNSERITTSGDVRLNVPRRKGIAFETASIERCRRRQSNFLFAHSLPLF